MKGMPILTFLTLLPFIGGLVLLALRGLDRRVARGLSLFIASLSLLGTLGLWCGFDPGSPDLQFVERHGWIPSLKVDYFLGADGLSVLMLVLSAFVVLLALLFSDRPEWGSDYHGLFLLLEGGLFGAFTALNFFHWFLYWELSLIPAYFLIKLWGGPERVRAATQFFVYTLAGSVGLLLAFLALYLALGSFDFMELARKGQAGQVASALSVRLTWFDTFATQRGLGLFVFFLAFVGFAVKMPVFPFHTWLPQTYAEAPTPVTMVLTGAMSKLGVYGVLRLVLPIFPEQFRLAMPWLLGSAVLSIVLSGFAALAQKDLKRILAYSSINHLGYCALGLAAVAGGAGDSAALQRSTAFSGVIFQMVSHGVTAAALFAFVSRIEVRSGGRRGLNDFGGLRQVAPVFCGLMGISLFASLGLPGLSGFVGEFLIFKGVFGLSAWAAVFAVPGLLLTAIVMLATLQKVFNGPLNPDWSGWPDLDLRERVLFGFLSLVILVLGIWPRLVTDVVQSTVGTWVENLKF